MNFKAFSQLIIKLLILYVLGVIMFTLARVFLMFNFGSYQDLKPFLYDILKAFIVGLRYDTVVINYALVLPLIVTILVLMFSVRLQFLERFANKFLIFYTITLYFIFTWVLIIDFYFYKFFQSHLNLLAFGIIKDDTAAVIHSVWTDYPVIWILIGVSALFYIIRYIVKRIVSSDWEIQIQKRWSKVVFILLFFMFFGIGLRGSLGTFPIEKDDAVISANSFVNTLTMNGVFSLKDALFDKSNYEIDADIPNTMHKYGFADPGMAVSAYLGKNIVDANAENALIDTTSNNELVKQHPLNVVFILMESMSNYYLDFQSPNLNVLGTLESVLPDCYLFRNFLSARNGTIHSLEGLMIGSPLTPLSQSKYMGISFKSSVALPFIENGYETSFVTGAKLGWRNLDKFVARQHFQRTEGSASLLSEVPGAKTCEWGVFDEFMFQRIEQLLKAANGKPQFIFGFSTTNHTPYQLPETYKALPVNIPDSIKNNLRCDVEIARKNLTNYQYANDCLGRFIKALKESPLGENTMVVATGDHNTLALFNFTDKTLLQKLSVPLVMYVPEKYRKGIYDPQRFGSHKDIFPTIFNLALSKTAYLKTGNNLLSEKKNDAPFFSLNDGTVGMNQFGCVVIGDKPLFYGWGANKKTLEPYIFSHPRELDDLAGKVKSQDAAITFYIQKQLAE